MLWWALAALFAWLGLREIYYGFVTKPGYSEPQEIFKGYVALMLVIAAAFAYQPIRTLLFEQFLAKKARILAEKSNVTVHCNTLFDTAVDPMSLAAGYASFETGKIAFQVPWCSVLMGVVRHPERMDRDGIFSVQMFVHEAMHVRGERNEAITECQAIQRYYRAALLLGIPDDIARKSGTNYYNVQYKERGRIGGMLAPYYSDECAPGKKLDEHLDDSTWKPGPDWSG